MIRKLRTLATFAVVGLAACGSPPPVAVVAPPAKPAPAKAAVVMPEAWNRWHPLPWDATPAPPPAAARLPVDPAAILSVGGAARTFASLSEYDREKLAKGGIRLLASKETTLGEALREPLTRGTPILLTTDGVGLVAAAALGRALVEARTRIVEPELPALLTRLSVALRAEAATPLPPDLVAAYGASRAFLAVPQALLVPTIPRERDISALVNAEIDRLHARAPAAPSLFGGEVLDGEALPPSRQGPVRSRTPSRPQEAEVRDQAPDPALALAWLASVRLDFQATGEGGIIPVDEARRNARIAVLLLRAFQRDPEAQAAAIRCDRVFAFAEGPQVGAALADLLPYAEAEGLLGGDLSAAANVVVVDRFRKKAAAGLAAKRGTASAGTVARRRNAVPPFGVRLFAERAFVDVAAVAQVVPAAPSVPAAPAPTGGPAPETLDEMLYPLALVSENAALPAAPALAALRPAADADARHASAWGSWISLTLAAGAVPKTLAAQPFSDTELYAARRADGAAALWLGGRLAGRLVPPAYPELPVTGAAETPLPLARLVVVEPDPETFVALAATLGQVRASLAAALPADGRDPVLFSLLTDLEETLLVIAQGSVAATAGSADPRDAELLRAPARLARLADRFGVDAFAAERIVLFRDHARSSVHLARIGGARKLLALAWDRTSQKPVLAEGPVFVPSHATVKAGEGVFQEAPLAKRYRD